VNSSESKSPHILNISANLFGFCFLIFTYLEANKISPHTYLDEVTAGCMFLFMVSCSASFLAIRSNTSKSHIYEAVADYVFMAGMFTLFATTLLIVFKAIV